MGFRPGAAAAVDAPHRNWSLPAEDQQIQG